MDSCNLLNITRIRKAIDTKGENIMIDCGGMLIKKC
jgi:hypothetical protein